MNLEYQLGHKHLISSVLFTVLHSHLGGAELKGGVMDIFDSKYNNFLKMTS